MPIRIRNTAKKNGFEIRERLIIVSFKCLIVLIAPNVSRICAGVVFRGPSARTNAWLKILLLMITYYSLIDILQPKQQQNNEQQPKLSTSCHSCTNTIVVCSFSCFNQRAFAKTIFWFQQFCFEKVGQVVYHLTKILLEPHLRLWVLY